MNRHEAIEQAAAKVLELASTWRVIHEYMGYREIEELRDALALPDAEPVAYITQAALEALKRGASSSVRVWLNPDEPNGDVALYTKENL